jgi:hypothetical protein
MAGSVASIWSVPDRRASPIARCIDRSLPQLWPADCSRWLFARPCDPALQWFAGGGRAASEAFRPRLSTPRLTAAEHDSSVWIMLGNRLINPILIVGTVGGKRTEGVGKLVDRMLEVGRPNYVRIA